MLTDADLQKIETMLDAKLEEKLANYPTKDYLNGVLDAKFDEKLKNYPTKSDLKNELKQYNSKDELKKILEPYATKEDLKIGLQTMQNTIISQLNLIIEIIGEQNERIRTISHRNWCN